MAQHTRLKLVGHRLQMLQLPEVVVSSSRSTKSQPISVMNRTTTGVVIRPTGTNNTCATRRVGTGRELHLRRIKVHA
jgi:hypothetical protein